MFNRVAFWCFLIFLSACTLDDLRNNAEEDNSGGSGGSSDGSDVEVKAFDDCPVNGDRIEGCWRSACTAVDIVRDEIPTTVYRQAVAKFQGDQVEFQRWEFSTNSCLFVDQAFRIADPVVVFTDNGNTFPSGGDNRTYRELELSYQYSDDPNAITATALYTIERGSSSQIPDKLCFSENFQIKLNQILIYPLEFSAGYQVPTEPCLNSDL